MVDIPLATSDYFRLAAGNPSIPVRNLYYETDPTNTVTGSTLIRRPGIVQLMDFGLQPIRKMFHRVDAFNNSLFIATGTALHKTRRTDDTFFTDELITGTLAATGDVDMTASGDTLFITDSTSLFYTDGTAALSTIATPDGVAFSRVAYIGGYVICVVKDSQRFYWITPGEVTIDDLDFAEAEGLPDGIVDLIVLGDQIYFFGKETTEIWYLSGDASAPFQRIQGKLVSIGAVEHTACLIQGSDTFFFISADGVARIGAGFERVSTPAIEERIRRAISAFNYAHLP